MQKHKTNAVRLNDEHRKHEIINGEVVYMSPRPLVNHSVVSGNIYTIFNSYLKGKKCRAYVDGVYIRLDKMKNAALPGNYKKDRLIPDAMIVCNPDIIKTDGIYARAPDLVVEVLSPSTSKNDKGIKKIYTN